MAALVLFHSFAVALAEKKHNLASDQLKVALVAAANAPSASGDAVLADLTQIGSYATCTSRDLTTVSSSQSGGVYKLVIADHTISATGGNIDPFRYSVVYNDTATNDELVGYLDYEADIELLTGQTFTFDFDGTNGAVVITISA